MIDITILFGLRPSKSSTPSTQLIFHNSNTAES